MEKGEDGLWQSFRITVLSRQGFWTVVRFDEPNPWFAKGHVTAISSYNVVTRTPKQAWRPKPYPHARRPICDG